MSEGRIAKTKRYLGGYVYLTYRATDLKRRRDKLLVTASTFNHTGKKTHCADAKAVQYTKLSKAYELQLLKAEEFRLKIDKQINSLADPLHREILCEVYCNGVTVKQLALRSKSLSFSERHIYRILGESLLAFHSRFLA